MCLDFHSSLLADTIPTHCRITLLFILKSSFKLAFGHLVFQITYDILTIEAIHICLIIILIIISDGLVHTNILQHWYRILLCAYSGLFISSLLTVRITFISQGQCISVGSRKHIILKYFLYSTE